MVKRRQSDVREAHGTVHCASSPAVVIAGSPTSYSTRRSRKGWGDYQCGAAVAVNDDLIYAIQWAEADGIHMNYFVHSFADDPEPPPTTARTAEWHHHVRSADRFGP